MTEEESNGLKHITYQAGETIFAEGDIGDQAYIVESGVIEISRNVSGKKVTLGTVEENGIFGEMALIDEATRMATASAVVESVCITVPKVAIQAHLADADPLLRKLVNVLVANARSLSDHITRVMNEDN
ncbi:MAG: cAMP-binding protein [Rhodospirillaceae bacterium]|nr:cAMP-binding protein [Rhodospirillaceae bacterium]